MQRRKFLMHAGALAGTAALGQMGVFASRAAAATDYKALVCLFLYGGNDSNNMVIPVDAAGYANYAKIRADLALPQAQLLPLQESGGVLRYGFHPALPGLQGLWTSGNLAVVANVGTLVQPLTQAQYHVEFVAETGHFVFAHRSAARVAVFDLHHLIEYRLGRPAVGSIQFAQRQFQRAADDLDRRQQLVRHRRGITGARDPDQRFVRPQRFLEQRRRCGAALRPGQSPRR